MFVSPNEILNKRGRCKKRAVANNQCSQESFQEACHFCIGQANCQGMLPSSQAPRLEFGSSDLSRISSKAKLWLPCWARQVFSSGLNMPKPCHSSCKHRKNHWLPSKALSIWMLINVGFVCWLGLTHNSSMTLATASSPTNHCQSHAKSWFDSWGGDNWRIYCLRWKNTSS